MSYHIVRDCLLSSAVGTFGWKASLSKYFDAEHVMSTSCTEFVVVRTVNSLANSSSAQLPVPRDPNRRRFVYSREFV